MTLPIEPRFSIDSIDERHHAVEVIFGGEAWRYVYRSLSAAGVGVEKRIAVWRNPALRDQTVLDFASEWLSDYVAHECIKGTLKDYKACCKSLVIPLIGDKSLSSLDRATIGEFIAALDRKGGYPSTNRGLRTLSAMLTVAESWDYIPRNPTFRRRYTPGGDATKP